MTSPYRRLPPAEAEFPARYARTGRFTLGTPRNIRVTGNGSQVLFCRSKDPQDSVLCLWAIDVDTGHERLVVDPTELTASSAELPPAERARRERARESASGIVAYSLDDEGHRACFALAGALFVADIVTGNVISPELDGSVFDPRLNGPGTAVAYVDGQALRVVELAADGTTVDRTLRHDADPLVSYGRAEFIAGEEMGRLAGYWWAPDGLSLLAARVDENPVAAWWIPDPAHPEREPQAVRYPASGTANAVIGLELLTLDGAGATVEWSDGGRFEYLADVVWTAGHQPLIVRQTRDQRTVSIAELAPDGTLSDHRVLVDDYWVELVPGSPQWCSAGLLTIEDQGYARRLVLNGQPLTGDNLNVRSMVGVLDDNQGAASAVVSAWTVPTEIHLAVVALDGSHLHRSAEAQLLTVEPGVYTGVIDAETIVISSTGPEPDSSRITIHRLDPGGPAVLSPPLATMADHSIQAGFAAAPFFCQLGLDRLETALFLPRDHDGVTKLPVLLDPYGGPHAQRALKNHNPHLVSRWLAENGYAVVVTDGRGTPGRGPAWERAVWGDLAGPILDDQVAALDAVLEQHPFLDPTRVGIRGWSFGGYLAALAVLRRPDRFHAAVAGAPVTTWRLYDTHYSEQYLGHPERYPEHYQQSDLWVETEGGPQLPSLERPLLLIHGLADDNVVAAHTLRFSTALLATGSPHRVLPLSGVTHMTPQLAVAENLLWLQLSFLDETIGPDRS